MDEHRGKWEFSEILLEALGACDRDSFPTSISCLLLAAHYLYQVQKQTERSLSLMRRIKTYAI